MYVCMYVKSLMALKKVCGATEGILKVQVVQHRTEKIEV
jgi:hypothetical protein